MQLGVHVGPLTSGAGSVSVSVPCQWIPFPYLDCVLWPQWERLCPAGIRCPRVGWYPRGGFSLSEEKGKGQWGREYEKVGQEGQERGEAGRPVSSKLIN